MGVFNKLLAAAVATLVLSACGSSSSGPAERDIRGIALSVLTKVEQPNRDFVVIDLAKSDDESTPDVDETVVARGVSDIVGAFAAKVGLDTTNIFVAFPPVDGEPRTSGLFDLSSDSNDKTLEDFTDIACVAGVSAVREGAILASELDQGRITNLEAAAIQVLQEQSVDFNDNDSFNAAVTRVRELTNDGANAPGAS